MNPMNQYQQEEDSDYDIFASVRPGEMEVDDNISDELDGEDVNYGNVRPTEDQITEARESKKKPKKDHSAWETTKDVAKQGSKEFLIGLGGTYGDLAELVGLNKENPSEKSKNYRDSATFDRLNQPGYEPTFSDIHSLGDDNDILPSSLRLPTSNDLRKTNDAIGGPGEAETMAGRYSGRIGKIGGSSLALGQGALIPSIIGGAAGQTAEELDVGPLGQAAAEIVGLLTSPGQAGKKALESSVKKEVANKVKDLRRLGYTDQDITLAINSSSKGKKLGVKASKGSKTEKAFEDFAEHSDAMVSDILEDGIQGYEKGSKHVHDLASDAYGQVVKDASKINITKMDPFFDSMHATMKDIKRSIGHNPEAKNFLTEITDHTLDIISNPTADNMIDFYRRLNGLGKWMGRNQKDRIITNVKESIKDTFKSEGKHGKELADKFEKVNQGIAKAYKAEDISKIIDKSSTQNGIDYNKLTKAFDKKDNIKLFEEVLGSTQTKNLQMMAKTGKEIKDFDKSYKATSLLTGTNTSLATNIGYLIYSGNWPAVAAMKGLEAGARRLAEKSLTDPKFQNLLIRGLHSIKNGSPRTFRSVNDAMQEYMDEQGIKVNLTK